MPDARRRLAVRAAVVGAVCAAAGHAIAGARAEPAPRRIALTAKKFTFDQEEIRMRKGERVTLLLASLDFAHGFSVPDLDVRVDLVPGKVVEVELQPERAGHFTFLCDNFCGEGHDEMGGTIVVTED